MNQKKVCAFTISSFCALFIMLFPAFTSAVEAGPSVLRPYAILLDGGIYDGRTGITYYNNQWAQSELQAKGYLEVHEKESKTYIRWKKDLVWETPWIINYCLDPYDTPTETSFIKGAGSSGYYWQKQPSERFRWYKKRTNDNSVLEYWERSSHATVCDDVVWKHYQADGTLIGTWIYKRRIAYDVNLPYSVWHYIPAGASEPLYTWRYTHTIKYDPIFYDAEKTIYTQGYSGEGIWSLISDPLSDRKVEVRYDVNNNTWRWAEYDEATSSWTWKDNPSYDQAPALFIGMIEILNSFMGSIVRHEKLLVGPDDLSRWSEVERNKEEGLVRYHDESHSYELRDEKYTYPYMTAAGITEEKTERFLHLLPAYHHDQVIPHFQASLLFSSGYWSYTSLIAHPLPPIPSDDKTSGEPRDFQGYDTVAYDFDKVWKERSSTVEDLSYLMMRRYDNYLYNLPVSIYPFTFQTTSGITKWWGGTEDIQSNLRWRYNYKPTVWQNETYFTISIERMLRYDVRANRWEFTVIDPVDPYGFTSTDTNTYTDSNLVYSPLSNSWKTVSSSTTDYDLLKNHFSKISLFVIAHEITRKMYDLHNDFSYRSKKSFIDWQSSLVKKLDGTWITNMPGESLSFSATEIEGVLYDDEENRYPHLIWNYNRSNGRWEWRCDNDNPCNPLHKRLYTFFTDTTTGFDYWYSADDIITFWRLSSATPYTWSKYKKVNESDPIPTTASEEWEYNTTGKYWYRKAPLLSHQWQYDAYTGIWKEIKSASRWYYNASLEEWIGLTSEDENEKPSLIFLPTPIVQWILIKEIEDAIRAVEIAEMMDLHWWNTPLYDSATGNWNSTNVTSSTVTTSYDSSERMIVWNYKSGDNVSVALDTHSWVWKYTYPTSAIYTYAFDASSLQWSFIDSTIGSVDTNNIYTYNPTTKEWKRESTGQVWSYDKTQKGWRNSLYPELIWYSNPLLAEWRCEEPDGGQETYYFNVEENRWYTVSPKDPLTPGEEGLVSIAIGMGGVPPLPLVQQELLSAVIDHWKNWNITEFVAGPYEWDVNTLTENADGSFEMKRSKPTTWSSLPNDTLHFFKEGANMQLSYQINNASNFYVHESVQFIYDYATRSYVWKENDGMVNREWAFARADADASYDHIWSGEGEIWHFYEGTHTWQKADDSTVFWTQVPDDPFSWKNNEGIIFTYDGKGRWSEPSFGSLFYLPGLGWQRSEEINDSFLSHFPPLPLIQTIIVSQAREAFPFSVYGARYKNHTWQPPTSDAEGIVWKSFDSNMYTVLCYDKSNPAEIVWKASPDLETSANLTYWVYTIPTGSWTVHTTDTSGVCSRFIYNSKNKTIIHQVRDTSGIYNAQETYWLYDHATNAYKEYLTADASETGVIWYCEAQGTQWRKGGTDVVWRYEPLDGLWYDAAVDGNAWYYDYEINRFMTAEDTGLSLSAPLPSELVWATLVKQGSAFMILQPCTTSDTFQYSYDDGSASTTEPKWNVKIASIAESTFKEGGTQVDFSAFMKDAHFSLDLSTSHSVQKKSDGEVIASYNAETKKWSNGLKEWNLNSISGNKSTWTDESSQWEYDAEKNVWKNVANDEWRYDTLQEIWHHISSDSYYRRITSAEGEEHWHHLAGSEVVFAANAYPPQFSEMISKQTVIEKALHASGVYTRSKRYDHWWNRISDEDASLLKNNAATARMKQVGSTLVWTTYDATAPYIEDKYRFSYDFVTKSWIFEDKSYAFTTKISGYDPTTSTYTQSDGTVWTYTFDPEANIRMWTKSGEEPDVWSFDPTIKAWHSASKVRYYHYDPLKGGWIDSMSAANDLYYYDEGASAWFAEGGIRVEDTSLPFPPEPLRHMVFVEMMLKGWHAHHPSLLKNAREWKLYVGTEKVEGQTHVPDEQIHITSPSEGQYSWSIMFKGASLDPEAHSKVTVDQEITNWKWVDTQGIQKVISSCQPVSLEEGSEWYRLGDGTWRLSFDELRSGLTQVEKLSTDGSVIEKWLYNEAHSAAENAWYNTVDTSVSWQFLYEMGMWQRHQTIIDSSGGVVSTTEYFSYNPLIDQWYSQDKTLLTPDAVTSFPPRVVLEYEMIKRWYIISDDRMISFIPSLKDIAHSIVQDTTTDMRYTIPLSSTLQVVYDRAKPLNRKLDGSLALVPHANRHTRLTSSVFGDSWIIAEEAFTRSPLTSSSYDTYAIVDGKWLVNGVESGWTYTEEGSNRRWKNESLALEWIFLPTQSAWRNVVTDEIWVYEVASGNWIHQELGYTYQYSSASHELIPTNDSAMAAELTADQLPPLPLAQQEAIKALCANILLTSSFQELVDNPRLSFTAVDAETYTGGYDNFTFTFNTTTGVLTCVDSITYDEWRYTPLTGTWEWKQISSEGFLSWNVKENVWQTEHGFDKWLYDEQTLTWKNAAGTIQWVYLPEAGVFKNTQSDTWRYHVDSESWLHEETQSFWSYDETGKEWIYRYGIHYVPLNLEQMPPRLLRQQAVMNAAFNSFLKTHELRVNLSNPLTTMHTQSEWIGHATKQIYHAVATEAALTLEWSYAPFGSYTQDLLKIKSSILSQEMEIHIRPDYYRPLTLSLNPDTCKKNGMLAWYYENDTQRWVESSGIQAWKYDSATGSWYKEGTLPAETGVRYDGLTQRWTKIGDSTVYEYDLTVQKFYDASDVTRLVDQASLPPLPVVLDAWQQKIMTIALDNHGISYKPVMYKRDLHDRTILYTASKDQQITILSHTPTSPDEHLSWKTTNRTVSYNLAAHEWTWNENGIIYTKDATGWHASDGTTDSHVMNPEANTYQVITAAGIEWQEEVKTRTWYEAEASGRWHFVPAYDLWVYNDETVHGVWKYNVKTHTWKELTNTHFMPHFPPRSVRQVAMIEHLLDVIIDNGWKKANDSTSWNKGDSTVRTVQLNNESNDATITLALDAGTITWKTAHEKEVFTYHYPTNTWNVVNKVHPLRTRQWKKEGDNTWSPESSNQSDTFVYENNEYASYDEVWQYFPESDQWKNRANGERWKHTEGMWEVYKQEKLQTYWRYDVVTNQWKDEHNNDWVFESSNGELRAVGGENAATHHVPPLPLLQEGYSKYLRYIAGSYGFFKAYAVDMPLKNSFTYTRSTLTPTHLSHTDEGSRYTLYYASDNVYALAGHEGTSPATASYSWWYNLGTGEWNWFATSSLDLFTLDPASRVAQVRYSADDKTYWWHAIEGGNPTGEGWYYNAESSCWISHASSEETWSFDMKTDQWLQGSTGHTWFYDAINQRWLNLSTGSVYKAFVPLFGKQMPPLVVQQQAYITALLRGIQASGFFETKGLSSLSDTPEERKEGSADGWKAVTAFGDEYVEYRVQDEPYAVMWQCADASGYDTINKNTRQLAHTLSGNEWYYANMSNPYRIIRNAYHEDITQWSSNKTVDVWSYDACALSWSKDEEVWTYNAESSRWSSSSSSDEWKYVAPARIWHRYLSNGAQDTWKKNEYIDEWQSLDTSHEPHPESFPPDCISEQEQGMYLKRYWNSHNVFTVRIPDEWQLSDDYRYWKEVPDPFYRAQGTSLFDGSASYPLVWRDYGGRNLILHAINQDKWIWYYLPSHSAERVVTTYDNRTAELIIRYKDATTTWCYNAIDKSWNKKGEDNASWIITSDMTRWTDVKTGREWVYDPLTQIFIHEDTQWRFNYHTHAWYCHSAFSSCKTPPPGFLVQYMFASGLASAFSNAMEKKGINDLYVSHDLFEGAFLNRPLIKDAYYEVYNAPTWLINNDLTLDRVSFIHSDVTRNNRLLPSVDKGLAALIGGERGIAMGEESLVRIHVRNSVIACHESLVSTGVIWDMGTPFIAHSADPLSLFSFNTNYLLLYEKGFAYDEGSRYSRVFQLGSNLNRTIKGTTLYNENPYQDPSSAHMMVYGSVPNVDNDTFFASTIIQSPYEPLRKGDSQALHRFVCANNSQLRIGWPSLLSQETLETKHATTPQDLIGQPGKLEETYSLGSAALIAQESNLYFGALKKENKVLNEMSGGVIFVDYLGLLKLLNKADVYLDMPIQYRINSMLSGKGGVFIPSDQIQYGPHGRIIACSQETKEGESIRYDDLSHSLYSFHLKPVTTFEESSK